jgi:acyl-CoA thioester hydrolase
MLSAETTIRVRYGETDQMGYAYYGVYAQYYEVGRVETMRRLGLTYREVESRGILMPVIEFSIHYKRPAFYDDLITITTSVVRKPEGLRIPFEYSCRNEKGELLNTGSVTLVCIDKASGKMCRIPDWFMKAFDPFFPESR